MPWQRIHRSRIAYVFPDDFPRGFTTDCDAQGAVCTNDGRKLSRQLEITVSGPGG